MARIIEYDERDYGSKGGVGGGSAAAVVILLLLVLYLSGYLPWFTNASTTLRPGAINNSNSGSGVIAPAAGGGVFSPSEAINYVTADNLYMRRGPGNNSPATYVLPRGTRVTLLGETYREPDGDVWSQVRIETNEGVQIGWVNRRYIS